MKKHRDWYTQPDVTDIGVNAAMIMQRLLNADDKAEYLSASSKKKDQAASPSPASSIKDAAGPSPSDQPPTTPTRPSPSPSEPNTIKDAACPSSSDQPPTTPTRPSPSPSEPRCSSPAASTRSHLSTHGTSSQASTLVSGRVPPSPASKVLSDYQKKQIEYVFRAELAGNKPLTNEVAQRKMALNTVLAPLSHN